MRSRQALLRFALALLLVVAATAVLVTVVRSRAGAQTSAQTTTVYVLRHAEKRADQGDDPDLTREGRNRARSLVRQLVNEKIDRIYATEYRRTQLTVLPLAVRLSLPIVQRHAADVAELATAIRGHAGETIVVSGHSNTIPELLAALGVTEPIEIPDEQYGDLFVVRISNHSVVLERSHYGF